MRITIQSIPVEKLSASPTREEIYGKSAADIIIGLPLAGALGYGLSRSIQDSGPTAVDIELTHTMPTATSLTGKTYPPAPNHITTAGEIGFAAIPMILTAAAVAIRTAVQIRRAA